MQKTLSLPLRVSESVTLAGALTEAQISTFNDQTLVIDLLTVEEGSGKAIMAYAEKTHD